MSTGGTADEKLQLSLIEETDASHRLDNLNLFIYMMLLILTILTAWFFKHFRNRYIHETGLALVYGLLIGVLIRETSTSTPEKSITFDVAVNVSQTDPVLPKLVILKMCPARDGYTLDNCSNVTSDALRYYEYSFSSVLQTPQKQEQLDLSSKATFDPEVFFNIILPAIIFHAGYSLKRRHFFVNIGAILMFAFFGTAISAVAIASVIYAFCQIPYFSTLNFSFNDAMLFGSIISATDPVSVLAIFNELGVDVDLHALILGESVLNDAVAIVLSGAVLGYARASLEAGDSSSAEAMAIGNAIAKFFEVFLGAFAIGTATSLVTALITKFTRIRDFPLLESSLFLLMSYSTFLAAEAASFSGIVALLFCGIFQAHYTYYNLSPESRTSLRYITELLSFLAENFCFVQIGVTIFTFSHHYWDLWFIMVAILAIIIGRAVNVYPLSFIMNRFARRKISYPFQNMMMFAGLRGAMAFALAIRDTQSLQQRVMFSTTLVLVIVTIIVCGALVTPVLQLFHIRVGVAPSHGSSAAIESENRQRRSGSDGLREGMDHEIKSPSDNMDQRKTSNPRLVSSSYNDLATTNEMTALQANTPSVMLAYASTSPPSHPPSMIDEMTIVSNENQVLDMVSSSAVTTERHRYSSMVIRGWKRIDAFYLKPLFTQSRPLLTETMPKNAFCQWMARSLTTTQQFEMGNEDDGAGVGFAPSDILNGGPTPSPPHGDGVNDTDDEPIMMDSDSPNIAGYSGNRKASGSFTASSGR